MEWHGVSKRRNKEMTKGRTINKSYFLVAASVLAFLLILAVYLNMIYMVRLESLKVSDSRNALKEETGKAAYVSVLEKAVVGNEALSNLFDETFIDPENIIPVVEVMENIGKTLSTKPVVKSIDLDDKSGILRLSISATGSLPELWRTLVVLESLPYLTEIVSVDFAPASAGNMRGDEVSAGGKKVAPLKEVPKWIASYSIKIVSLEK